MYIPLDSYCDKNCIEFTMIIFFSVNTFSSSSNTLILTYDLFKDKKLIFEL